MTPDPAGRSAARNAERVMHRPPWTFNRVLAIGLSAYELIACTTGRVPPLTNIIRHHPVLAGISLGYLAVHFMPGREA